MKRTKWHADSRVLAPGRPIYLPGGDRAALLIHGYLGSPSDMRTPALRLNREGFTVHAPRLAGHATDRYDLAQTDWRDWLRSAIDAYLDLASTHRKVYLVGLSMGGAICAIVAARFRPQRLAFCAPAFLITRRWLSLTPLLGLFVERFPDRGYRVESEDPEIAEFERRYFAYTWVRPAAHLLKLKRLGRQALRHILCPTLTIVSNNDRAVPASVADLVDRSIGTTNRHRVVLEESGHVVTEDCERDLVADEITTWFKEGDE